MRRGLWRGLTELVSMHEQAYLEHCRQYALGVPAPSPEALLEAPPELVGAEDSSSMLSAVADADAPLVETESPAPSSGDLEHANGVTS